MDVEKELNIVKRKYRRLVGILLITILLVIVIFGANLIYTSFKVRKILKDNLNADLGKNYKITRVDNYNTNYIYFKDGVVRAGNIDHGVLIKDNATYIMLYDQKQYFKTNEDWSAIYTNASLINYFMVNEDNMDSIFDIILFVLETGCKLEKTNYDGKEYIILNQKLDGAELWINKETGFVEKEYNQGQVIDIKIEKDVVTDDDLKDPFELGFEERALED